MGIKELLTLELEKAVKKAGFESKVPVEVAYSTDLAHGDYTTNWPMQVAKDINQSPLNIANILQRSVEKNEIYETPEVVAPGFINFRLSIGFLTKHLNLTLIEGTNFGFSSKYKGKRVLIEFSSPNVAKPMHIGHLRNTNIGQSLTNVLNFVGYQTITDNHIGDWGTQYGKVLWAYKMWGRNIVNPTVQDLLDLYVRFHNEVKTHPHFEVEARQEFLKLEQGDEDNVALWGKFRKTSIEDFDRIYNELGVHFDHLYGESFYVKDLPRIVDQALQSGVAKRDPDDSIIIPLDTMLPFLILKSDGATLYGTRDLATAKFRVDKIKPDVIIYVIASEQQLYMQQLFAALSKLGWTGNVKLVHVSYGLTKLASGKMSTRSGDLVSAAEVIAEAKIRAEKVIREKSSNKTINRKLVSEIALGALKWADLKISRDSEVIFDWERIFSFEGNSGPYMQYTYARAQSILKKAGKSNFKEKLDLSVLSHPKELSLMRLLVKFPEVVLASATTFSPHIICNYAFELAQEFSSFYESVQVLSDSKERNARLALTEAVSTTLQTSLGLLGIATPKRL